MKISKEDISYKASNPDNYFSVSQKIIGDLEDSAFSHVESNGGLKILLKIINFDIFLHNFYTDMMESHYDFKIRGK